MRSKMFVMVAVLMGFTGVATWGATAVGAGGPSVIAVADDPACEWLGWRHPACAGGSFDDWGPVPDIGPGSLPDNGGQMVPNIDGGLSLPGSPGAI